MRAPFCARLRRPTVLLGRCSSATWTLALLLGAVGGSLSAANPDSRKPSEEALRSAEALLQEALACEIDGRAEDRDALLKRAEALAPDAPAIKWQRGLILTGDKWTPAEEIAVDSANRAIVAEYVALRSGTQETLEGHLAMAQWCQERNLFDQERAHLTRVLKYEPDHARARARLSYVRIDDEWFSREEIALAISEEARAQASIRKNGAGLQSVVEDLSSEYPAIRERAAAKIAAIRDVELIPLLERVVASVSEEASLVVLRTLAAMPEKEASLSIARFAVLSPSAKVSVEAERLLQDRKFDHFVPQMIASMVVPTRTEFAIGRGADGRLFYRHSLLREAMRSADLLVLDTVYDSPRIGVDPVSSRMASGDFAARAAMTEAFVKLDDLPTHEFNARTGETLEKVTEQKHGADAQGWWNWWEQHNEMVIEGDKALSVQYAMQTVLIPGSQNNALQTGSPTLGRDPSLPQHALSCFAAGTTVMTNRGEVAIEKMQIGDLVLAQDVESGELAFKPVLDTTVGPPTELVRVDHAEGSFRCTGGHPFWVSGEGWTNARFLKSGMELHTLDGPVRVSEVVPDGVERAYNLIVDDFSTYFVEDSRFLCHDITSPKASDAIVPGLAQK